LVPSFFARPRMVGRTWTRTRAARPMPSWSSWRRPSQRSRRAPGMPRAPPRSCASSGICRSSSRRRWPTPPRSARPSSPASTRPTGPCRNRSGRSRMRRKWPRPPRRWRRRGDGRRQHPRWDQPHPALLRLSLAARNHNSSAKL